MHVCMYALIHRSRNAGGGWTEQQWGGPGGGEGSTLWVEPVAGISQSCMTHLEFLLRFVSATVRKQDWGFARFELVVLHEI